MRDSDPKKPDPRHPPTAAQPDHLLDELTSIRALLDSEQRATTSTNIPMLDDVVGFAASFKAVDAEPAPALLDLEHIFSDDGGDSESALLSPLNFPKFTLDVVVSDDPGSTAPAIPQLSAQLSPQQSARATPGREALIQELVAEFLPQIEAALRERLASLGDSALHALKKHD